MSTIFLDPVAMDAAAGAIHEHVKEVEALVEGLEVTCCVAVPPSLEGWLAEELHEIAVHARLAALLYVVAALDTAVRAQQIQTDQSLATATPALPDTVPTWAQTSIVGGPGSFNPSVSSSSFGSSISIVGGPGSFNPSVSSSSFGSSTAIVGGVSRETFLANNPLLAAAENLRSSNPAAAAQLMGLQSSMSNSNAEMGAVWTNSRPGASYVGGGLYRGYDGNIGSISDVYRNPDRPGEFLVG